MNRRHFEQMYADHYDAVYRYCLRRTIRDDALDATAETFATAWRRRDDIPRGRELPWLYGVARNHLSHQRRSAGRYASAMARLAWQPSGTEDRVEDRAITGAAVNEMVAAIERLKADDREIIRLAGWEELDREEVAVALGCTPNAATKKLNRALDRLAGELGVASRDGGRFFTRRAAV